MAKTIKTGWYICQKIFACWQKKYFEYLKRIAFVRAVEKKQIVKDVFGKEKFKVRSSNKRRR